MSFVRSLSLVMTSALAGLLLSELVLATMHPLPDPYFRQKQRPDRVATYVPSQFPPNLTLTFQAEDGLPGMERTGTFSINNMGFRGDSLLMPKPAGELRIFMVGGSTTEGLYLDDSHAITRVLQDTLSRLVHDHQVRVYGAGKSGDKSYDHVAMIAHRIAHLQPDVIIVFAGINDLLAGIMGRDYLFYPVDPDEAPTQWRSGQLLRFAATELQLGRLLFAALKPRSYREVVEEITLTSNIRGAVEQRKRLPLSRSPPQGNPSSYRENLTSIVGLARAHGTRLVFINQPTTWNSSVDRRAKEWHWMNIGQGVSYPQDRMQAAMDRYNGAMRRVAERHDIPLLNLRRVIPPSLEYFYDDVHPNRRGASTIGTALAHFLVDRGVVTTGG